MATARYSSSYSTWPARGWQARERTWSPMICGCCCCPRWSSLVSTCTPDLMIIRRCGLVWPISSFNYVDAQIIIIIELGSKGCPVHSPIHIHPSNTKRHLAWSTFSKSWWLNIECSRVHDRPADAPFKTFFLPFERKTVWFGIWWLKLPEWAVMMMFEWSSHHWPPSKPSFALATWRCMVHLWLNLMNGERSITEDVPLQSTFVRVCFQLDWIASIRQTCTRSLTHLFGCLFLVSIQDDGSQCQPSQSETLAAWAPSIDRWTFALARRVDPRSQPTIRILIAQ